LGRAPAAEGDDLRRLLVAPALLLAAALGLPNAEELLALLAALDLRDTTVVGWSYGGATSIVAARRDPSRVAGLVLVGSVGPGIEARGAPPDFVVSLLTGPVLAWIHAVPPAARWMREATVGAAFHPAPVPEAYLRLVEANFARPHTLESFRSEGRDLGREADLDPGPIDRAILVLHGEDDQLVPFSVAQEIHARAKRSELRAVPKAGHMLPITHVDLVAGAIAEASPGSEIGGR
jgi:pimeloyl-ACP methyl ester carboxylesterase